MKYIQAINDFTHKHFFVILGANVASLLLAIMAGNVTAVVMLVVSGMCLLVGESAYEAGK